MKKFFIIEDDFAVRYLLNDMLKQMGHEVLASVDNIASAIQFLKASKIPDVILLDVVLPGEPGTMIIDYIKANHSATKIVLTTGLGEERVLKLLPDGGYDAILQKPFKFEQMQKAIEKLFPVPPPQTQPQ